MIASRTRRWHDWVLMNSYKKMQNRAIQTPVCACSHNLLPCCYTNLRTYYQRFLSQIPRKHSNKHEIVPEIILGWAARVKPMYSSRQDRILLLICWAKQIWVANTLDVAVLLVHLFVIISCYWISSPILEHEDLCLWWSCTLIRHGELHTILVWNSSGRCCLQSKLRISTHRSLLSHWWTRRLLRHTTVSKITISLRNAIFKVKKHRWEKYPAYSKGAPTI